MHWLGRIAQRDRDLFVLWQLGVQPEAPEGTYGPRGEAVAADLVAGEGLLLEQHDVVARLSEEVRRRAAAWPGADDDRVRMADRAVRSSANDVRRARGPRPGPQGSGT